MTNKHPKIADPRANRGPRRQAEVEDWVPDLTHSVLSGFQPAGLERDYDPSNDEEDESDVEELEIEIEDLDGGGDYPEDIDGEGIIETPEESEPPPVEPEPPAETAEPSPQELAHQQFLHGMELVLKNVGSQPGLKHIVITPDGVAEVHLHVVQRLHVKKED